MKRKYECIGIGIFAFSLWLVAPVRAAEPVRVATLVPFVVETLASVPTHAVVVASVRRSMHDPVPAGVVDLGSPHAPSFERLAEARPALIVGDRAMHAALAPRLEATGAKVLLLEVDSVPATLASVGELGRAVGAGPELEKAASGVREEIAGLRLARPVPTLPLFGTPASFLVITGRTWLGSLLEEINLANVAGGLSGAERVPGYAAVSDEVIATLRPTLVLVVAHGDGATIERTLRARMDEGGPWAAFETAAQDGVHVLDPTVFSSNPGLALPTAARRLRALAGGGPGV